MRKQKRERGKTHTTRQRDMWDIERLKEAKEKQRDRDVETERKKIAQSVRTEHCSTI